MTLALLLAQAGATPSFDPDAGQAYTDRETYTQDGLIKLWSRIERHDDPDRQLFGPVAYNEGTAWIDAEYSPFVATLFQTSEPAASTFLLHAGLNEGIARGTPILLVPGAGDNASRGFVTLATRLDRNLLRPVYALTFAHPHGDVFEQAEVVADAIAVIKARTGAEQVDLLGHSKGGIAAALYASNLPGTVWSDPDYLEVGTRYRGDVRRMVLVATPLGGIDTAWRWSALNLFSLDPNTALAPTSWDRYYPSSTALPLLFDPLADQDFLPDGRDYFPGQRQLLARQPYTLPGQQPFLLGGYALQPDWYSTYEGGIGFQSRSPGIDAAINAGGRFIEQLAAAGVDSNISLYLLAGDNPIMPNGDAEFQEQWSTFADGVDWQDFIEELDAAGTPLRASPEEIDGLERGALVLGEVTGPSDGLVFTTSALAADTLTARGAVVVESRQLDLSHLDLLYASPITGDLLVEAAAEGGPEAAWMAGVGARYRREDSLGLMEGWLWEPPSEDTSPDDPSPDSASDTGDGLEPPASKPLETEFDRPCGSCTTQGGSPAPWLALLSLLALMRRRPS